MDNKLQKSEESPANVFKNRLIRSVLLISIGVVLFICGAVAHSVSVLVPKDTSAKTPSQKQQNELQKLSEFVIVRDVTIGGLIRLGNGNIKRTYAGQPPALCPT